MDTKGELKKTMTKTFTGGCVVSAGGRGCSQLIHAKAHGYGCHRPYKRATPQGQGTGQGSGDGFGAQVDTQCYFGEYESYRLKETKKLMSKTDEFKNLIW